MIDQTKFLGHENLNGNTVSLRDLQKEQQALWANVFIASVRSGQLQAATMTADAAVAAFNARFVPIIPPTNYQHLAYTR